MFERGEGITVVKGRHKGKHGTFVEVVSMLSYRVVIDGERHTLRKTSITRATHNKSNSSTTSNEKESILEEIEQLERTLKKLRIKVNSLT